MAIIKQLKETNSDEKIYPITHVSAVLDNDGNSVGDLISSKQNALVSGSNIKTVNGNSLLGSGNVRVAGFQAYSDYDAMQDDHTQQDGTIGFDGDEEQFYIYNSQNGDWLPLTDEVVLNVSWWFYADDYNESTYETMLNLIDTGRPLFVDNYPVVVQSANYDEITLVQLLGDKLYFKSVYGSHGYEDWSGTFSLVTTNDLKDEIVYVKLTAKTTVDDTVNEYTASKTYTQVWSDFHANKFVILHTSIDGEKYYYIGHRHPYIYFASMSYNGKYTVLYYNINSNSPSSVYLLSSNTLATVDDLATKQDTLTFDSTPTSGSTNPVTSGGVYTALQSKYATLTKGVATIDGETANYTAIYTFFSKTENAYLVHGNKKYHLVSESGFANPLIFVCVEESIIYCLRMAISGQWTEKSYDCTAFKEYVSESAMFSDNSQPNGTIAFAEENESFYIWNSFSYEWKPLADFTPNVISSVTATESTASGGNNTVTITQSNGTTTTFNVKNGKDGKDGADGVSLGEVAIADDLETNDSEKVLSAKQGVVLKEKTDPITDDDKNGLTERVKKKLASLGWEYGKYLSRGTLKANAAYCVTPLIQIDNTRKNHSLTFSYQFNSSTTQEINLFTSDATYKGYYSCSANNLKTFNATADAWDSTYYLRLTLNPNKIRDCYVKDNTTGEYLWKGSDVLDEVTKEYLISYDYYKENLVVQETGEGEDVVMSQKAVTDAINYSQSVVNCQCAFITQACNFTLSDEQVSALNNTNIISIVTVRRSALNPDYPIEWRYFRLRGSTAGGVQDGFYINCASVGGMHYTVANANNEATANQANRTSGGVNIRPAVSVIVWDRINGIVRFYDRTTLISEKQNDIYKLDAFVATNNLYMFPGDDQLFLYDMQIYNYDIMGIVDAYINELEGANYLHNYYDGNLKKTVVDWRSSDLGAYGNNSTMPYSYDGGVVTITSTDSCVSGTTVTQRGYYVGSSNIARIYESDIEVVSGECRINNRTPNKIEKIVNTETGEEYAAGDTLGVGKYTIYGRAAVVACWSLTYMSGSPMVVKHTANRQKFISCVMHLKCDTIYNGKLYDDQAKQFYDVPVNPSNTALKKTLLTTSRVPNFAGQMAIVGNNAYIGTAQYTWKQINNS